MSQPDPAPTPQKGRPGKQRLERERRWAREQRDLIEQARANGVTTELRDGRTYVVLRIAPQVVAPGSEQ